MAQENRKLQNFKIIYCLNWIIVWIFFPIPASSFVFTANALPPILIIIAVVVLIVTLILFMLYYIKLGKPLRKRFEKALESHYILLFSCLFLLVASPGILYGIVLISFYGFGWDILPIYAFIVCYAIIGPFWTVCIIKILKSEIPKTD